MPPLDAHAFCGVRKHERQERWDAVAGKTDLVVPDRKGEIYGVRYEAVNAMLLNEFLKEHRTVREQQKEIDVLRAELKEQRAFIQKVNDKVELNRPAPQTVASNQ